MAKGTESKNQIMQKMLEVFPNSFLYNDNKEVRIPWIEDGEELQIKVTLTAAKTAVQPGEDNALPQFKAVEVDEPVTVKVTPSTDEVVEVTPTQEERDNLKKMLEKLGL